MEEAKLSGRVIIETILTNMRQQVEELRYSKIVPAAYDVYLHPDDQQRFESLAHEIAAEAVRALQEKLDDLNRPDRLDRVRELVKRPRRPFKKVGPWLVRIARDLDGVVPRGRALVVSQIAIAGAESFEGQRTRRLATLSEPSAAGRDEREVLASGPGASVPRSPAPPSPATATRASTLDETATEVVDTHETARAVVLATLSWEDRTGAHRFRMTRLEITVGRAAPGATADLALDAPADVSRLHCRLRYRPVEERFEIEDTSLLGTTVNGEAVAGGTARELPSPAEIRLADAITLRFERVTP